MTATGPKECPKANVLNCLPKRSQPKAKKMLHDIWQVTSSRETPTPFEPSKWT
jgi:hypothetical protein